MTPEVHVLRPRHGGSFEVERARARRDCGHLPLVLVPGIGGPRGTFHHQVRAFAEDRDVVATNLNPVLERHAPPIDSAARDVLHVLDAMDIAQADVLGASFGSCITARLTEMEPGRVRCQVWVAPPVIHHAPWRAAFGPGWLIGGTMMKYAPERYRGNIARLLAERRTYSVEPDLCEEELHLLAGRATDIELGPFFRRFAGLRDWDWRRMPDPVPRPLLVVQGVKEHRATPADVRQAWVRLSGRPIALTDGTHMPYLSYPQQFNPIVREFLADPTRTAGPPI